MRMIIAAALALALVAPAIADQRCYDPRADIGCGVHWSGTRGGGRAWSPNCHHLPLCAGNANDQQPTVPGWDVKSVACPTYSDRRTVIGDCI